MQPENNKNNKKQTTEINFKILTGLYKGKNLTYDQITRPTLIRARKFIFDVIFSICLKNKDNFTDFNCLDCFAGSGALGLECVSNKAHSVTFIEKATTAYKHLAKNITTLKEPTTQIQALNIDFFQLHKQFIKNKQQLTTQTKTETISKKNLQQNEFFDKTKFDCIFIDPPYFTLNLYNIIKYIMAHNLYKNGSLIIIDVNFDYDVQNFEQQIMKEELTQQLIQHNNNNTFEQQQFEQNTINTQTSLLSKQQHSTINHLHFKKLKQEKFGQTQILIYQLLY